MPSCLYCTTPGTHAVYDRPDTTKPRAAVCDQHRDEVPVWQLREEVGV